MKIKLKKVIKKTYIYKMYVAIVKINRIVNSPTFFPEYQRKSKLERYIDNYKWLFTYKRHNPSYNLYGLDVRDFRNQDDYVDIKYIKRDRLSPHHQDDMVVQHRKENLTLRYSLLADNKYIFYTLMEKIAPEYVVKTYFIFQGKDVIAPLKLEESDNLKRQLLCLKDGKYVCKSVIGSYGNSILFVKKINDEIIFNDGEIGFAEFVNITKDEPYLLQEYIEQSKVMKELNGDSVNTVRIVSTRWNENTNILAAMVRIGRKGVHIDNASNGGVFVGIDVTTGCLNKYGYSYDSCRTTKHPDSGVEYSGFRIPYWKECISIIKKLHPIIFGLATIGWDIAITENGPIVVEINWNYSIKGLQIANGGIKRKWEDLKCK
jgi:glutathione synthase/RimK-type ligase-like ATP-grasp enzyme